MVVDIDEGNLKAGLLALVVTLVEVIRDALKLQAFKRMEGGSLTEEEIDAGKHAADAAGAHQLSLSGFKVLSGGSLRSKIVVRAAGFSEKAKQKIAAAGGSASTD